MLDPKWLREHTDEAAKQLARRGAGTLDVARYQDLESQRKALQTRIEALQSRRNALSKRIGQAKARGEDAGACLAEVTEVGSQLDTSTGQFQQVKDDLRDFLLHLPNVPHPSVPEGASERDNQVVRHEGEPRPGRSWDDHVALGQRLGGLDVSLGALLGGTRFAVMAGDVLKLHRVLAQYMIQLHVETHGYHEVWVPHLVRQHIAEGTGQWPHLKDDLFLTADATHVLIPTAEMSVTNLVRDSVLAGDQLPVRWVCHTPCYRKESGSYGQDTRGMLRQHQFEKVELVHVVEPHRSEEALEQLTGHAEAVLQHLELPYRVVALCAGDLGFAASKTYDLEVWLPGQNRYREVSSCSNTGAFQARRMQARYRDPQGHVQWVHTLNGSALAVGRTLIAVMENYQDEGGSVVIPEVLRPWFPGQTHLKEGPLGALGAG